MYELDVRTDPHGRAGVRPALALAVAVLAVCAAGWIGWTLQVQRTNNQPVRVSEFVRGTVTDIGSTGDYGCITPADGGRKVCSTFAFPDDRRVSRGDEVLAAREWIKDGAGVSADTLLIYRVR